nr:ATP-binding protein [Bradyrhizobium hipponense]
MIQPASNRRIGESGSTFGDPVVATPILDSLLHHTHVITMSATVIRKGLIDFVVGSHLAIVELGRDAD